MLPSSFLNLQLDDGQPEGAQNTPPAMSTSNRTSGDVNSGSSAPTAQLSCELCRQRKVKCDKTTPCSTCRRAGVTCIPVARQRLPRGRVGGRKRADAELKARVGRLEKLIRTLDPTSSQVKEELAQAMQEEPINLDSSATQQSDSVPYREGKERIGTERYLGSQFWSDLSQEINGLRDTLLESSDDETEDSRDSNIPNRRIGENYRNDLDMILFAPGSFTLEPTVLQHPAQAFRVQLCQIYRIQVDEVIKVIHGPTLTAFMEQGNQYLDYPPGHFAVEALSFAVYYVAICSQTEEQCAQRFGTKKADILSRYRFATEVSLAQAGLVTTNDITVLQAFLIYIVATRASDLSKRSWALLSLAIQLARGIGLHVDPELLRLRPFEKEMRRRLWYIFTVVDMQSSLDRAMNPIIAPNSFDTRLPLNINDVDFTWDSPSLPTEKSEYTDITFGLVTFQMSMASRRLNWCFPRDPAEPPAKMETDWAFRREHAAQAQVRLEKFLEHCDPSASLLQWQHYRVAQNMIASLHLISVRPLQRHPDAPAPPVTGAGLLKLAIEVLERGWAMKSDPRGSPYRWLESIFVHWHPLAVAIAELCVLTKGDLVERAWHVVDICYVAIGSTIADSTQGMLWRPIEKLMKKARGARKITSLSANPSVNTTLMTNTTATQSPSSLMPGTEPLDMTMNDQQNYLAQQSMNPVTFDQSKPWSFSNDGSDMKSERSLSYSPGEAWQSWDTFVADLADNSGIFDMNFDEMNFSGDWDAGIVT